MWWTSSSGDIELQITKRQAEMCSHSGDCEPNVKYLLYWERDIKKQMAKLNPAVVAAVLWEYGAWNDEALADHNQNLIRLLWIACGDIHEETYTRRATS